MKLKPHSLILNKGRKVKILTIVRSIQFLTKLQKKVVCLIYIHTVNPLQFTSEFKDLVRLMKTEISYCDSLHI